MSIRVLIVDDEPVARRGLRTLLQKDADVEIAGEAANGAEAVRMIRELHPDLVLLDVQMPEMSGFDVLAEVGVDAVPVLVFVTAWDDYALRAFDVQALDYLLKPFDDERFRAVLARAKRELDRNRDSALARRLEALLDGIGHGTGTPPPPLRRILVRTGDTTLVVPAADIDWVEAADYYARLHVGATSHLVSESLSELERQLDPDVFVRVHRSAIVNLARIREVRLDYRRRHVLVLSTGAAVPLSRSRREAVERVIAGRRDRPSRPDGRPH
jgi:two-component system LytT family response regulator